jgi:hypothetical protein
MRALVCLQGSRIFVEDLVAGGPAEESADIEISDILVSDDYYHGRYKETVGVPCISRQGNAGDILHWVAENRQAGVVGFNTLQNKSAPSQMTLLKTT